MEKLIRMTLWLGGYDEVVYLLLGALLGLFIERCVKKTQLAGGKTKKKLSGGFIIATATVLAVSSWLVWVNNNYTLVPDIIGLTYNEAAAKLHAVGLSCSEDISRYGEVVIGVSPDADYVQSGSSIKLEFAKSPTDDATSENDISETIAEPVVTYETVMPDVYMVQEQAALKYLITAGFENVEILPQYSDATAAGYVLRSEPFAEEPMNYSDRITLYVSVNEVTQ